MNLLSLRRVALLPTLKFRVRGQHVTVYRGTKVCNRGTITVGERLDLGALWPRQAFHSSGTVQVESGGRLEVEGAFRIHTGLSVVVDEGATLRLGQGGMNDHVRIECFQSITIGHNVLIGPRVWIRDSDSHQVDGKAEDTHTAPIVIEDNCWIGLGVTILKGVRIGAGSIVAAGSVVVRSVPPGSLVAGVPATVRRSGVSWH